MNASGAGMCGTLGVNKVKYRLFLSTFLILSLSHCAKLDDSFATKSYFSDETRIPPEQTHKSANVVLLNGNSGLGPTQIGVVINDLDPQSVAVGAYYQKARHIPNENIIHVSFPVVSSLPSAAFTALRNQVWAATPAEVQAYAVTWTYPWKIDGTWWAEGQAISSGFAHGYHTKWFSQRTPPSDLSCQLTAQSSYYASNSKRPYNDLGIRPTMLLGGLTVKDVTDVIDRGVESDGTHPVGKNYLVRSSDPARNVRYPDFILTSQLPTILPGSVEYLDYEVVGGTVTTGYITNKPDIMGYFTGFGGLNLQYAGNTFLKGAVADNLTSCFGYWDFPSPTTDPYSLNSGCYQGASLAFLKAGATATSGTVVEPCNFTQKFPQTSIFLPQYQSGKSVIEAYTASVMRPGETNFAGEPLANPYAIEPTLSYDATSQAVLVSTVWPVPGAVYRLEKSKRIDGPFITAIDGIRSNPTGGATTIKIKNPETLTYYRLREVSASCTSHDPTIAITPGQAYGTPDAVKEFQVTVTNQNAFNCPTETFHLNIEVPGSLTASLSEASVTLNSFESGTVTLSVSSLPGTPDGNYEIKVGAASATYTVDSVPPSAPTATWYASYNLPGQGVLYWTPSVDAHPGVTYKVWVNGEKIAEGINTHYHPLTVPVGTSTVIVEAVDLAGNSTESTPLVLNRLAPEFSITFNEGAPSMVKTVIVTFNQTVWPEPGAIEIQNQSGDPVNFNWTYGQNVWTATYPAASSLPDGNYFVVVHPDLIYTTSFIDLYPASTQEFHRLFGDINGNRFVNNQDYNQFKLSFGTNSSSPLYKVGFDYDANGFISNPDYNQFKLRFGTFLAP